MERLTLDAAAARLGLSAATVRRRVRDGTLAAEQEPVRGGFRYVVLLDGESAGVPATPAPAEPIHEPTHEPTQVLTQVLGERDHLRALVVEQQRTIDRLTILLKQEQDTARLLAQPTAVDMGSHEPAQQGSHEGDQGIHMGTQARRPLWAVLTRLWGK